MKAKQGPGTWVEGETLTFFTFIWHFTCHPARDEVWTSRRSWEGRGPQAGCSGEMVSARTSLHGVEGRLTATEPQQREGLGARLGSSASPLMTAEKPDQVEGRLLEACWLAGDVGRPRRSGKRFQTVEVQRGGGQGSELLSPASFSFLPAGLGASPASASVRLQPSTLLG